jgi:GT2 family glycosyltransferase
LLFNWTKSRQKIGQTVHEEIAIIIINYNLKQDTADCISSLLKAQADLAQITVVDNGSSDGSISFLRQQFGQELRIEASESNQGFAYAVNLGINAALLTRASWFLIMNNDTLVDTSFLNELSIATKNHPDYGLFGPLILYYSQPNRIWFLGDRRIPGTLATVHMYYGKDERQLPPEEVIPVDFLNGCTMMVNRNVVKAIGLFNETSLIYAEEVDFCWRATQAGFRMATVPKARMWHKVSAIMNKQKPKTRYLKIRNQVNFYRRYSHGLQIPIMVLFTVVRSIWLSLKDLWLRQPELLAPLWQGFLDGWRGKMGDNVF